MIGRALRKAPDDRWQSMQEVHGALAGLRQKFESGILRRATLVPPGREAIRSLRLGLITFFVVFGIGGWLVLLRARTRQPRRRDAASDAVRSARAAAAPTSHRRWRRRRSREIEGAADESERAGTGGRQSAGRGDHRADSCVQDEIRSFEGGHDSTHEGRRVTGSDRSDAAPVGRDGLPPAAPRAGAARLAPVLGGIPFEITLMQEVPIDPVPGTALHFQAAKDVHAGGAVIIAKGAAVTGRCWNAARSTFLATAGSPPFD